MVSSGLCDRVRKKSGYDPILASILVDSNFGSVKDWDVLWNAKGVMTE